MFLKDKVKIGARNIIKDIEKKNYKVCTVLYAQKRAGKRNFWRDVSAVRSQLGL